MDIYRTITQVLFSMTEHRTKPNRYIPQFLIANARLWAIWLSPPLRATTTKVDQALQFGIGIVNVEDLKKLRPT